MEAPKAESRTPQPRANLRLPPRRQSMPRRIWDRIRGRKKVSQTSQTMLPALMRAYAGFCKIDGKLEPDELDTSLEALRYDYPEEVFFELRAYFLQALREPQDLNEIAAELSSALNEENKILLGVQLYTLISQTGRSREQLLSFYRFMTNLGVASQAIDIVYQLNTAETLSESPENEGEDGSATTSPGTLETLLFGHDEPADVILPKLRPTCRMLAFRYLNLVMLKNVGEVPILVRGRRILPGEFCRVFENQRVLLEEIVIDFADLLFYFNAKKDLHGTQLYLSIDESGDILIEDTRDRNTHLLIQFGLGVKILAIRDTPAEIRGVRLDKNRVVEASLQDNIHLGNDREISLMELRRRAKHMGGTFRLEANKSEYLISNDASRLRPGDILISGTPEQRLLLRITRDPDSREADLEVIESSRPVYAGDELVKGRITITDGDVLTIGDGQYLRCQFTEGIIEEERNIIRTLDVRELSHRYGKSGTAIDGVFFTARRGEMICVMGPSGCGKSTLLRILGGQLQPNKGEIRMNDVQLYENRDKLTPYICYIPHEDAFDPLLTVEENLDYSAAIRCPELSTEDRRRRADARLIDLGLNESRHRLAGQPEEKNLSGGERKRLNAGLDMISHADIYLFDEPTSGLSSKDSEHVLDIIRTLAENKTVLVSIHQPSARLFQMFHKAMLLDKGGKLVYFGTPQGMLEYFWNTWMEETGRSDQQQAPGSLSPDFIFDILETPLRDVSGDVIYETTAEGHLQPARRFPPNFWRDRYQAHNLLENVTETPVQDKKDHTVDRGSNTPATRLVVERPRVTWKGEWVLFVTMLKRSFLSKLRNKANLFTSLLEAPALGILIAVILRYSEEESYSFATAFHIPTYLFLSLVVAMFLGLTNSADEIIRDRVMLMRERNHNVRITYYILGKVTALGAFAAVQCVIYILLGNLILGVRDMFAGYFIWMFLTSMVGVTLGLLVSSLVKDSKTALNIIPLLLIPQILLGGALIKYEEMNTNLDFVYSLRLLPRSDDADEPSSPKPEKEGSKLRVPLICEFMPLRWSYEAMVITQAKHNPMSELQDELETRITKMISPVEPGMPPPELTERDLDRLNTYKDALAMVASLQERNSDSIRRKLKAVKSALLKGDFHADDFESKTHDNPVSADEVYINRKIMEMVAKAEFERLDYRLAPNQAPNVFFGLKRTIGNVPIDTRTLNFIVLGTGILTTLVTLGLVLRRQLSRV